MNPALETLPDTPAELKQIIIGLCDQHERQIDVYVEQIRHLRQLLFCRRSEKMPGDTDKVQLPLFDMPEPEQIEPIKGTVDAHARKKPGRKPLPPELPRVEVVIDLPEDEKVCGCGCTLSRIGEEVSEQLDIIPAKIQVIRKRLIKHLHAHLQHLQFVDIPRQKCLVVFHGLGVGQVRKDMAEIAVGLAFVCPGGLDQAEEHCTGLGALWCSGKEPVLTAQHEGSDSVLSRIVVRGEQGFFQIDLQPVPLVEGVADRLTQESFWRCLA